MACAVILFSRSFLNWWVKRQLNADTQCTSQSEQLRREVVALNDDIPPVVAEIQAQVSRTWKAGETRQLWLMATEKSNGVLALSGQITFEVAHIHTKT